MNTFATWLQAAPEATIPSLTAGLAAVVAVFVAVLTQWVLGQRARPELLTQKLEELYLVLNDASAHNVSRVEAALPLATATPFNKVRVSGSTVTQQGLDLQKKLVMYVRLYFPKLTATHQAVFAANHAVNALIHEAENGPALEHQKLLLAARRYGEALSAMEGEVINNRAQLVCVNILPRRHRRRPASG